VADVFVSYSRQDREFVRTLHQRLTGAGRDVWVDWEDIPPSADWRSDIEQAIEAADTFVFVLSPASLGSKVAIEEVAHAARGNKRIVPIVVADQGNATVPEAVARVNWLFFRPPDDFDQAFVQLQTAIETDLTWVRAHSRLLVRAREWETHQRDKSYLLAGQDLEESERLLAEAGNRSPSPSDLHVAYVAASRGNETDRQRNQLRGFYLVSLIYGCVQSCVSYVVAFDEISETGLVALSPIWVLGIVFGLYGLTFGKTSLKQSVIATVIAGLLLYLFFTTIFPML